ncbi:MAG TPA: VPLPA-CTERM-specific exosortase XrtD, partial [Steroidobacteraceae bacterium]|nr:VPLPA-CTERM-specific exosortase XrtD [Steroidobacteraceae bacterium]
RAAGISVFLAGNVIDLGTMQLQVAEACSGLRYLFPLMTLAFLVAYVFRAPLWKRALVFLSSIPIAILMNGLRIGFIGITSEHWGPRAAEGVLHNFEGWLVFMLSLGVVLLVAFALTRLGPVRSTWPQAFPLLAAPPSVSSTPLRFTVTKPFVVATAIVTASAIAGFGMQPRQNTAPHREDFLGFPMSIGAWQGRPGVLDQVYLDALRLDDYVLADYRDGANAVPVNFYSAYYNSQRGARRAHSPRNCIPGGGWEVQQSGRWSIHVASVGRDIPVRRVFISLGDQKQLVYYWYQERGRLMTDDNVVKWFLFWDSLTRNRTDGALVRLVTPLPLGASVADADARLQRFMNAVVPLLGPYIPD